MNVDGKPYRSIWYEAEDGLVHIIDQRWLPHEFRIAALVSLDDFAVAIRDMWVRGAPLIGATAAWGIATEMARDPSDHALQSASDVLAATRPTAINLAWALERMKTALQPLPPAERAERAHALACEICDEDVEINHRIGQFGLGLIEDIAARKPAGEPVRILTHCNAGWIATVDWGTATSPMYQAADKGIPLHVWVGETRPRNQGALTAWELGSHGVPHAYITDNAGGHLMQHGQVDIVIIGSDRTTATGDVCNKIGTYLKALSAQDNDVPFYVALPSPTIDWNTCDGVKDIPIEERPAHEINRILGRGEAGIAAVEVTPPDSPTANPAFDVTPARLVTGLITERGITAPDRLRDLFPEFS